MHLLFQQSLKKMIKNKKVLIIGCGFSALDLKNIPDDVLVFTCKRGVKLLIDKNFNKKIDLYVSNKMFFKAYPVVKQMISKIKIKNFLFDEPRYLQKQKKLRKNYDSISKIFNPRSFLLSKLISPISINQIQGKSMNNDVSMGLFLFEYALYYKAKEIFLIGIDLGRNGYFWDKNKTNVLFHHEDIDENFLKIVSKKYKNIYSLSKNSPIIEFFPYKDFQSENKNN